MKCVKCSSRLAFKRLSSFELNRCILCEGIWMEGETLTDLIQHRKEARIDLLSDEYLSPKKIKKFHVQGVCPECQQSLYKKKCPGTWFVHIEVCPNGHGQWIDGKDMFMLRGLWLKRIGRVDWKFYGIFLGASLIAIAWIYHVVSFSNETKHGLLNAMKKSQIITMQKEAVHQELYGESNKTVKKLLKKGYAALYRINPRYKKSERYFKKALHIEPHNILAHEGILLIDIDLRRKTMIPDHFLTLVKLNPRGLDDYQNMLEAHDLYYLISSHYTIEIKEKNNAPS